MTFCGSEQTGQSTLSLNLQKRTETMSALLGRSISLYCEAPVLFLTLNPLKYPFQRLISQVIRIANCESFQDCRLCLDFMQRKLHDQPVSSKNYCPLENTPGVLLHGFV